MFCNKCGAQLPDNATFCSKCGAPISNAFQTAQQPQTSQAKPKNNKPIIIGLSVAIVVLLIPLIILISKIASGDGSEAPTGSDHEHNTIATVADDVTEKESSTEGAVNGATSVQTTTPVAKPETEKATTPSVTKEAEKATEKQSDTLITTSLAERFIILPDEYVDPSYWEHPYFKEGNGPEYSVIVTDVSSDYSQVTFYVNYVGVNLSPVYTTEEITVTLDKNHSASFNWTDSWSNSGTGTITFGWGNEPDPYILLTMKQTVSSDLNRYSLETTNKKLKTKLSYAP